MPVTINLINAVDGWPVLILALIRRRIDRPFTIVGSIPISHDVIRGMRRVDERIVLAVANRFNTTRLFSNFDHRVARSVELFLIRSLSARSSVCRQPAMTWWAHGTRSPSAVWRCLQRLFGAVLECPDVDDAFVCDATDCALVEHGKMRLQTVCHIVGVENGDFGCVSGHFRP